MFYLLPHPEAYKKQRDSDGAKVMRVGTGFGVAHTYNAVTSRPKPGY